MVIFDTLGPLRRLRPSPPRVGSSGAGSGSSAAALQTFHIMLHTHCSRVALSGSISLLSGDLPRSFRLPPASAAWLQPKHHRWRSCVAVACHFPAGYRLHSLCQDALASAKFGCTHPSLSCSLSYPQVLRDAARPAVRAPAAPCCRQTGVCLNSRGGCPWQAR